MKKAALWFALLCTVVCLLCGTTFASEVWDGTAATSFDSGSGTEDDPYLISNGAQLAGISDNSYYRLTADIYLNDTTGWESWTAENGPANVWTPLFSSNNFQGTLDGDGHTIYGLYIVKTNAQGSGLFGRTSGAEFRDLSIGQSAVFGYNRVGSLIGEANDTTIRNCHSSGIVAGTDENIAGLVGHAYDCAISDCSNSGTVSGLVSDNGMRGVAGIVGQTFGGTVENCSNTGTITGYNDCIGGIAGHTYSDTVIENCENRGSITILDVETTSTYGVGGIAGRAGDGGRIINCRNYVAIQAEAFEIGGITGLNNGAEIINCENSKPITGTHDVGGIIGDMYDGLVDGCVNTGAVTATTNNSAGGIAGAVHAGSIRNTSNEGDVTSPAQNCGGITGTLYSQSEGIFNCRNTGTITGPSSVGGICGNAMRDSNFQNCLNIGTVTATNDYPSCGAIAGRDQGCAIVHSYYLAGSCSEVDDAAKITEITEEALKSPDFLETLNDWVQSAQRPTSGYATWKTDEDGYPAPTGKVPAYVPVVGNLTLTQPENGTATLSADSALTGTTITVTVAADTGYTPYQVWYCTDDAPDTAVYAVKSGKNTFTFSMPHGNTEVFASCMALPESSVWDGTVADAFAGGDGTENNPYLIGNAAQLALLETHRNRSYHYRLIADIYLNDTSDWENWTAESAPANVWTPISSLRMTLDGDGYTIYGLYTDASKSNQGLFYQLQNDACLKNITIDKSRIFGADTVGAFVAINSGSISNCVNRADVDASGNYVGGIVGRSGNSDSTVEGCANYGAVTCPSYCVGGIIGDSYGTVKDCINYGTIKHTSSLNTYSTAGGIAGCSSKMIHNCKNYGSVSGLSNVGGIAGSTNGTITACVNYAKITGNSSAENDSFVGGIVGVQGRESLVADCVNQGAVSSPDFAGGICGVHGSNDEYAMTRIKNCVNQGSVQAPGGVAGGIISMIATKGTVSVIEQCVNEASVSAGSDGSCVGGIAGFIRTNGTREIKIYNCYNTGSIQGHRFIGGLVGEARAQMAGSSILVENSYSSGTVSGSEHFSGTVGYIRTNEPGAAVMVRNCYSLSGKAPADVTRAGGPGAETVSNVKALTAAQMGQQASFTGFDFDTVWYCAGDGSYPTLLLVKDSGQMGEALIFTAYQNGTVIVTADGSLKAPVYALAVSYKEGRMADCKMVQLSAGQSGTLILRDQGDSMVLLALSGQYKPLSEETDIT